MEFVVPNPGNKPGSIQMTEDGLYKVTFVHAGAAHILGLFASLDESHRVCDVLAIKAAVDAGGDLASLNLHCDLHRYGVDPATAGEIRSVSFRQVVSDLQVCCTQPLHPLAAEETTSWAAVAMSVSAMPEPAGAAAITNSRALRQPAPSIARAAFHQAGAANAAAAHFAAAIEEGAVDVERGPWRLQGEEEEEVSGGVSQQEPRREQQQEEEEQQGHSGGDLPAQRPDRHAPLPAPRAEPSTGQRDVATEPDRVSDGPPDAAPARSGSRKRRLPGGGGDAEGEQQEGAGAGGRRRRRVMMTADAEALQAGPQSSGPAAGAAAETGSGDGQREDAAASVPNGEAGEGTDPLAFTAANHPFHGITVPSGGSKAFAQVAIKYDGAAASRGGRTAKILRFKDCSTPAEAAASWDLGAIWRALQYGEDPAALDQAKRPSERLNFGFGRYLALLPTLRACATLHAVRAAVNALRDDGGLARLASGSWQPPGSPQPDSAAGGARPGSAGAAPPAEQPEEEDQGGERAGARAQEGSAGGGGAEAQQGARAAQRKRLRVPAPRPRQRQREEPSEDEQGDAARPPRQTRREEVSEEARGEEPRQQQELPEEEEARGEEPRQEPEPPEEQQQEEEPRREQEPPEEQREEEPRREQHAGDLPAAQQGQQPAADAAPESPAAPGRRRGQQVRRRRGPSGARGVSGKGPWKAQLALQQAKVLPSKARLWESMRGDVKLHVPNCLSHAAAAACADLLLLWRCLMYGDDPEEADLNLPLERYRHLLPALDALGSSAVVPHVQRLRDRGALDFVLLAVNERPTELDTVQSPDAGAPAVPAFLAGLPWDSLGPSGDMGDEDAAQLVPLVSAGGQEQQQQGVAEPAGGRQEEQQQQQQGGAEPVGLALPLSPQLHQQSQREWHVAAAAAHDAAGVAASPRRERLQRMGAVELRQVMYTRFERGRVEAHQAAYAEVESMLVGLQPDISEEQAVAYMGQYLIHRDLRSLLHHRLTAWHAAGRRDLLLGHVRATLPREERGEGREGWLDGLGN